MAADIRQAGQQYLNYFSIYPEESHPTASNPTAGAVLQAMHSHLTHFVGHSLDICRTEPITSVPHETTTLAVGPKRHHTELSAAESLMSELVRRPYSVDHPGRGRHQPSQTVSRRTQ
jgi:hypothetical protein